MEFNNLRTEVKNSEFDMTRADSKSYFEAVIKKVNLGGLVLILESNLGPQAWPSQARLAKEAEAIINNFGGLRKGQTLYFLKNADYSIFAMLWPWQDGERVTIKMGKV